MTSHNINRTLTENKFSKRYITWRLDYLFYQNVFKHIDARKRMVKNNIIITTMWKIRCICVWNFRAASSPRLIHICLLDICLNKEHKLSRICAINMAIICEIYQINKFFIVFSRHAQTFMKMKNMCCSSAICCFLFL